MRSFDITICLCQQFASAKKVASSTFFDRQKRKPIKVLKLYTNAIFVVAQGGFSAQVEIKIGIRRDEKIRYARRNSSSGNPP